MQNVPLRDMNYDPAILKRLAVCKDLCWAYNQIPPSHEEEQTQAIKGILRKTGERIRVLPYFWCDFGSNIEVGEDFYANHGLTILDTAKVIFGDHVFIGPDCGFYAAGHPLDIGLRNQGLEYALPIHVGNDVWFGGHVTVCPGVTIGDGTTIGAGSVVTHGIPANVLAAGNPCEVIRKLK